MRRAKHLAPRRRRWARIAGRAGAIAFTVLAPLACVLAADAWKNDVQADLDAIEHEERQP